MKIAILGATSQIARDLIVSFSSEDENQLHLFARRPDAVNNWLESTGLIRRYSVDDFSGFAVQKFDAIINFVGVGNPAQAVVMGNSIFDVTLHFDEMVLDYLQAHPACRYLFLSSGAAYGSNFNEPVTRTTSAVVSINNLEPCEWYGVAKLYAECRHRAHPKLSIIDIRVFNYFSHTQDISARFLITDILRAIREKAVFNTTHSRIIRDYIHPSDFYKLIRMLLCAPASNAAVDCYSQAPIDKLSLLDAMQENFGLCYKLIETNAVVSTASEKPHYYSLNTRAADFGYKPSLSSLDCVLKESELILHPSNL